jgi:hypothetical protein
MKPKFKFIAGIRGKKMIENFHENFGTAMKEFLDSGERPCDLLVPENFKLYWCDPTKEVQRCFSYIGIHIRMKPIAGDEIYLTSYDSDRRIRIG